MARASNRIAMASKLIAMAPNLIAMASTHRRHIWTFPESVLRVEASQVVVSPRTRDGTGSELEGRPMLGVFANTTALICLRFGDSADPARVLRLIQHLRCRPLPSRVRGR